VSACARGTRKNKTRKLTIRGSFFEFFDPFSLSLSLEENGRDKTAKIVVINAFGSIFMAACRGETCCCLWMNAVKSRRM
jgi:hypothetical protein